MCWIKNLHYQLFEKKNLPHIYLDQATVECEGAALTIQKYVAKRNLCDLLLSIHA